MVFRGKDVALSLLTVGAAAAVGYVLRSGRSRDDGTPRADIGARIVSEVPREAPVVDASSRRLAELPAVREAISRALAADANEEWEHVSLEADEAWQVVDAVRDSEPYYEADGTAYNGIYVRCEDRFVVVDAIGWARVPEPFQ
ncbi:hypothetical protein ACYJ1Y_00600 [Natrialbaceae archaeon A-gly3]